MGNEVNGNDRAGNTTENSGTMIGSTLVTSTPTARRVTTTSTRWKCAASLFLTNLPHCQPKYCEIEYAADRPVSHAAPKVAATKPITEIASPLRTETRRVGKE